LESHLSRSINTFSRISVRGDRGGRSDVPDKDRPVLMAAFSINAHYLITGDSTHFGRYFGKTINGVTICRPRDYLAKPLSKKKLKI
jgi:predicted nucleic acid-binding protein